MGFTDLKKVQHCKHPRFVTTRSLLATRPTTNPLSVQVFSAPLNPPSCGRFACPFPAVAEAGNISLAAERLMISQPAVSKQLTELERYLGIPLFDRLPRGVRMTEAGRVLHGYARRIFSLADEAQIAVDAVRGVERGRL
ncbi:MAG: LysR family transcriptional regulator, partial [Acidobacteriales bacterium]|nr:LysR family transcriptional regulator [Terriglobales bacterium]